MEPFYRTILKRSWQITKKYKFLWGLGFLATFVGASVDLAFFLDYTDKISNQLVIWQNFQNYLLSSDWANFFYQFSYAPLLVKLFVLTLLVITVALLFLIFIIAISAKAGLVNGINEIEERGSGSFKTNFQIGTKFTWPVLKLIILEKIIIFLIITLLFAPLMVILIVKNFQIVYWINIIAFLIFLPLLIIINFVINYAIAYIVLQGKKMWAAIKSGWQLFINNWLISLEMAFILLIFNLVVGIIFIIAVLLISSPLVIMIILALNTPWFYFFFILVLFIIFLVSVIITIFLNVYQTTAWILLFLKLNQTKLYSKLERLTIIDAQKLNSNIIKKK